MAKEEIALDIVVNGLRQFLNDMGKAEGAVSSTASNWQKSGGMIGKVAGTAFKAVVLGAAAAGSAVLGFGVAIGKMAVDAAALPGIQSAFEALADGGTVSLDRLRQAAAGTVSDFELMRMANIALTGAGEDFGREFGQKLPVLLETARAAARATGQDVGFLFNSLVTGIKRGSPLLIDNTGLVLKVSEANQQMADSLGKSVEELTAEEKQIALLNATVAAGGDMIAKFGGDQATAAEQMAQLQTSLKNITDQIGIAFIPVLQAVLEPLAKLAQEQGPQLVSMMQALAGAVLPVAEAFSNFFGRLLDGEEPLTAFKVLLMNLVPAELFPKVMEIVDTVALLLDNLATGFNQEVPAYLETLRAAWDDVWSFIQDLSAQFITWFTENLPLIQQYGQMVVDFWQNSIVPTFDNVWEIIKSIISNALDIILNMLSLQMNVITGNWEGAWEDVRAIAESVWDLLGTVFVEFMEGMLNAMGTTLTEFIAVWQGNWESAKEIVTLIWDNISTAMAEKLAAIIVFVIETVEKIKFAFTNANWGNIGSAVIDAIADGIRNAAGNMARAAADAVRGAISAARSALGGLGGGGASTPVSGFQSGGTTMGRSMLVGESGPELLTGIPGGARVLSNPTTSRMLGGGNTTVNNYNLTTNSLTRPGGLALEFSAMEMGSR